MNADTSSMNADTSSMNADTVTASDASSASLVVTTRWRVAGLDRQRTAADTAMARWKALPWPPGCRSVTALLSTDGALVLFSTRWASADAYDRHAATGHGDDVLRDVGALVEVELLETITSRQHVGSPEDPEGEGPFPGCIVLVTIGTDGPDRQRQVAETIAAHVADPHPGGIGGRLLFSTDGTVVLNYAEWTSEEAHRGAVEAPATGHRRGIFDGMAGIEGLGMNRYQRYRELTAGG